VTRSLTLNPYRQSIASPGHEDTTNVPTDTDRPATSRVRRADVPNSQTKAKARRRRASNPRETQLSGVSIPALPRPKSDGYRPDISHLVSPAGVNAPDDARKRSTALILIAVGEKRNNYYFWAAPLPRTRCTKSHCCAGLGIPNHSGSGRRMGSEYVLASCCQQSQMATAFAAQFGPRRNNLTCCYN